jgi:multidrug efflux pump
MKEQKSMIQSLNALAIPLIIQSISSMIISTTDQAMIGRISVSAFGAVGSVYQFISILVGVLGCTVIIFNINGSKALGRKDRESFREELIASLLLSLVLGVVLLLGIMVFQRSLLMGIFGFSGGILADAEAYLGIVKWSIVIQMLIFSLNTYFKGIKKTKHILWVSLTASLMNLLLDYILIFGKLGLEPMGVKGAGYATVVSLLVNLLAYFVMAAGDIDFRFERMKRYVDRIKSNFHASLPIMGLEVLESNVFMMVITAIVSRQGEVVLAAYLLLIQVIGILHMPMFMYASAALTLVSEKTESNRHLVKSIPALAVGCAACFYGSIAILVFGFRESVFALINPDSQVVSLASILFLMYLAANIMRIPSTVYSYVLQAIGLSKFVLYRSAAINAISLAFVLASAYFTKGDTMSFLRLCAGALLMNYGLIAFMGRKQYKRETKQLAMEHERVS